jgi:hypothetical protein
MNQGDPITSLTSEDIQWIDNNIGHDDSGFLIKTSIQKEIIHHISYPNLTQNRSLVKMTTLPAQS